ncbi:hypothetical protein DS901_15245 [Loktanella sp. D2R18]|uniref:hypothetical protein n=1 Tax=Rhodobacterales TaxID=204455 RepID=UPI000DEA99A7|nr:MULTISPECIES: hypothetical protein [Rhodobacterales]MDO6588673.1 hypothetical protein [Yoonia sp. 1_MG-2023]RBW42079.1 hypothetical protein DS901_15245 [Loktanella sp. D2R18]
MARRTSEQVMVIFDHIWDCFDAARAAQKHMYDDATYKLREELLISHEEMREAVTSKKISASEALHGVRSAWSSCHSLYVECKHSESAAAEQFLSQYQKITGRNYFDDQKDIRAM